MTNQQLLLKYLEHLESEMGQALKTLLKLQGLARLALELDQLEPLDLMMEKEYQTVTEREKKAQELAHRLSVMKIELGLD
jgi:hypothetical protein